MRIVTFEGFVASIAIAVDWVVAFAFAALEVVVAVAFRF